MVKYIIAPAAVLACFVLVADAPGGVPVEPPDPAIAASWEQLARHNLALTPAPKSLRVLGAPLPVTGLRLTACSEGIEAGLEEIRRGFREAGGAAVAADTAGAVIEIVAGEYQLMPDDWAPAGRPPRPPPQGYAIRMLFTNAVWRLWIAGGDRVGALYGCVTLSQLFGPGPALTPAEVDDRPDFTYRMAFQTKRADFEATRPVLDQAFRAKNNLFNLPMLPSSLNDSPELRVMQAAYRKITEYARARGIRCMAMDYLHVGEAPVPANASSLSYVYRPNQGLMGHRGKAFSWSNDQLIRAKGRRLAEYMQATGVDVFYLHAQDTGGLENPENWNFRTDLDRKRFGDDRAAADANLIGLVYEEIRRANPEAIVAAVLYPYATSYLQYPAITQWLQRVSTMLPAGIFVCVRESAREPLLEWRRLTAPYGMLMYYGPYPVAMTFGSSGRYAATFYSGPGDIYWFLRGFENVNLAERWVASEYAWNTRAPGWAWLPSGMVTDLEEACAHPPEIAIELLPRVMAQVYGAAAADPLARTLARGLSLAMARDPGRYPIRDPERYFQRQAAAAAQAIEAVRSVAPHVRLDSRTLFGELEPMFTTAQVLSEARHRYFRMKRLIAEGDISAARAEAEAARNLPEGGAWFASVDSLIAEQQRRQTVLALLPPVPLNIGLYHIGVTLGLQEAWLGIPGLRTESIRYFTRETLAPLNVIMFAGSKDLGDADTRENWRERLTAFVAQGGGVIFSHNAVGQSPSSPFQQTLFPDICAGYQDRNVRHSKLRVVAAHPALGALKPGATINRSYRDHLTIQPGTNAIVLLRDAQDQPVMVAGEYGRGRVIYTGQMFGVNRQGGADEPSGDEWSMLLYMVRWAGGDGAATRAESSGAD